ncbi:protein PHYTOCHROME KINASE SUBSTRATE 1-like [Solanum dulcamara]|uniref:protein PHYTOCHROME KINASE SUBSTRATE 1-like n=1 Tax=Solanum dulcamara TaxID=45834 RepID=UPI0024869652|nr:protein PHYTOCHROME KINASE SUBSTRATE 1-like [Solanum dulcamara]
MAMVKVEATKSGTNLFDASFSSYLNGTEETIELNLESSRNLSYKADDGEIDIFSAEKYFNEGVDQENNEPKNKHKIVDQPSANIVSLQQKIRPLTPSIHSESSWNSRSALLQKVSRNHHHLQPATTTKPNNKSYGKKFLARISCNCYCKDKNSVEIDGQHGKSKSKQNPIKTRSSESSIIGANHQDLHFKKIDELGLGLKTDERFAVTVFDSKVENPGVKIQLQMEEEEEEEESRKSLEVFGFPITEKERSKSGIEKKIGMLTWDAIVPKAEEIDIINIGASSNGTYEEDYAESDASSDLFEIESFPSNNTANPSLVRQGSDSMSCYAPSEVSIDWSVVTASAADFSIMSDTEDVKIPSIRNNPSRLSQNGREKAKRHSSILLGCNSHKAVGVVGDAYKTSEKTSTEMHQRNFKTYEPIMPMTRFHAENKASRFDGRNKKHEFTTRSFASTYTRRPADFLYI